MGKTYPGLRLKSKTIGLMMAFVLAFAGLCALPLTASAAAGDVPAHGKSLKNNGDGTYTIALNVKGDSEKDPQKVNIIVIVDRSNSMNEGSGTGAYVPSNQTGTNMWGLVDGEYVQLTRGGTSGNRTFWYQVDGEWVQYTGQRYQYDAAASRIEATRAAVDGLASALLSYNGQDGNPDDTVEMALVDFATSARTLVASTTDATTFTNAVNSITPPGGNAGGTNWEMALRRADTINFGDNDPTYVIFFSDGAPTFYGTGPSGTGGETEPNMANSYNASTDEAAALAAKIGPERFYTIFAYGSNAGRTYMTNLTAAADAPAGNNYSASNTAELEDAFAAILEAIEMAGIGNVGISDGTTSNVGTSAEPIELLEVVPNFHYYRAGGDYSDIDDYDAENGQYGQEWADAPAAQFTDPTVTWNIDGVLENDVIYTVTFDCYPSQTTLDTIADIKNDPSCYDGLPQTIKDYIDSNGNLSTNTTASLTYTDTRTGVTDTKLFTNPDPVETQTVEEMAVSKEWKNELESEWDKPESITLDVTRDEDPTYDVTLNDENDWEDSVFISIGLIKDGEALEGAHGHDFTFVEPPLESGYKWEINVPVVHPMKIDGVVTMLILKDKAPYDNPDGADEYKIGDNTYYVAGTGAAALTATNERRSSLNITKVVDGVDVPEDAVFPFTLNVVNSLAPETEPTDDPGHDSDYWVWISVRDKDGNRINEGVEGATSAGSGWWYAPSGTDVTIPMKAGYSVRVNNVPTGTTYTITEGTLPTGFTFESATAAKTDGDDGGTTWSFTGGQTSTGSIDTTNAVYTVTYTNKYELIDINVDKVWADASNQDGIRPESLTLTLNGAPAGTTVPTPEITKSEDGNTWTYVWKGLPRFDSAGEEITYTVTEENVPASYTCKTTTVNDGGTITNTHEPEVIDIPVEKVWKGPAGNAVTVTLYADDEATTNTVTLNANNSWKDTFEDLPKYKNGKEIKYTVVEAGVSGVDANKYTTTIAGDAENGFVITNTNTEKVDVEATKAWDDASNQDGIRPENLTLTLNGAPEDTTVPDPTITKSGDNWTYKWVGLPKYAEDGTEIKYTVTEGTVPTGYTCETKTVDAGGTITNKHVPDVTTVSVKKVWEGPEATATITLKADGTAVGNPITLPNAGSNEYTWTNLPKKADGKDIVYTVTEEAIAHYTTTGPTGTGTANDPFVFTNTYLAEGEVSFPVQKVLSVPQGMEGPESWSYTFNVTPGEGAPTATSMSATVNQDADTATFGPFKFDQTAIGKTYTYTVIETGEVDGVENDSAAATGKTVTVAVSDAGSGKLSFDVSSTAQSPLTFTNTYNTEPTTYELKAAKVLAVEPPADNPPDVSGKYTLTLTATGDAPMPKDATDGKVEKTNPDGEGTAVSFGEISYTAPGEFQYTVSESGTVPGVTNGQESYTVKVKVSDEGDGTLGVEVTEGKQVTPFTNTYKVSDATLASLDVTKSLTGAKLKGGAFSFEVANTSKPATVETAPLPNPTTASNDADGKVAFGSMTFDTPGIYKYAITEVNGGKTIDGVAYDDLKVTATVTVEDNGEGELVATVKYSDDTEFNNTYEATGKFTPSVKKKLEGFRALEAEQFTFELLDEDGEVIDTATNEADGSVKFKTIPYDQTIFDDDDEGDSEGEGGSEGNEGTEPGDAGKRTAAAPADEATPADGEADAEEEGEEPGAEGEAEADADEPEPEPGLESVQIVDPDPEPTAEPTVFKAVESAEADEPDVEAVNEEPDSVIVVDDVAAPAANEAPVLRAEGDDESDEEEEGEARSKTFTYTIREVNGGKTIDGYTYDGKTVTVTVTVTDNGDGTLDVDEDWSDDEPFVNTYEAEGFIELEGSKTVTGTELEEGQFSFNLKEGNDVLDTQKNDAKGEFTFAAINYTKPGTYEYTIVEVNDGKTGYTYDDHVCTVTVTVTDNGDGTLGAVAKYSDGEKASFENPYDPLDTSAPFKAAKKLEGRDLKAGEFSFELVDADGKVVKTATNAADGSVDFGNVEFDKVGNFAFTALEVKGSDATITYDASQYTYKVEVVDDGGQLKATVTCDAGDVPTFKNKYTPEEPPVIPITGDNLPIVALVGVAIAAAAVGVVAVRRRSAAAAEVKRSGAHARPTRRR